MLVTIDLINDLMPEVENHSSRIENKKHLMTLREGVRFKATEGIIASREEPQDNRWSECTIADNILCRNNLFLYSLKLCQQHEAVNAKFYKFMYQVIYAKGRLASLTEDGGAVKNLQLLMQKAKKNIAADDAFNHVIDEIDFHIVEARKPMEPSIFSDCYIYSTALRFPELAQSDSSLNEAQRLLAKTIVEVKHELNT